MSQRRETFHAPSDPSVPNRLVTVTNVPPRKMVKVSKRSAERPANDVKYASDPMPLAESATSAAAAAAFAGAAIPAVTVPAATTAAAATAPAPSPPFANNATLVTMTGASPSASVVTLPSNNDFTAFHFASPNRDYNRALAATQLEARAQRALEAGGSAVGSLVSARPSSVSGIVAVPRAHAAHAEVMVAAHDRKVERDAKVKSKQLLALAAECDDENLARQIAALAVKEQVSASHAQSESYASVLSLRAFLRDAIRDPAEQREWSVHGINPGLAAAYAANRIVSTPAAHTNAVQRNGWRVLGANGIVQPEHMRLRFTAISSVAELRAETKKDKMSRWIGKVEMGAGVKEVHMTAYFLPTPTSAEEACKVYYELDAILSIFASPLFASSTKELLLHMKSSPATGFGMEHFIFTASGLTAASPDLTLIDSDALPILAVFTDTDALMMDKVWNIIYDGKGNSKSANPRYASLLTYCREYLGALVMATQSAKARRLRAFEQRIRASTHGSSSSASLPQAGISSSTDAEKDAIIAQLRAQLANEQKEKSILMSLVHQSVGEIGNLGLTAAQRDRAESERLNAVISKSKSSIQTLWDMGLKFCAPALAQFCEQCRNGKCAYSVIHDLASIPRPPRK